MDLGPNTIPLEELLANAGWVHDLARSLVRDASTADDAVQETWLSALRSGPDDRRNLRGWLARTLTNAVRQRARSEERRSQREGDHEREPVPTPDELAERFDMQRMLAEEVARLPEPIRRTILLRFYEGRTPTEIAHDTKEPPGTVRWHLHEGLAQLRAKLDARHGDRESWMIALVALVRRAPLSSSAATAPWGGLVLVPASTRVAMFFVVLLGLGGIVTWRAMRVAKPSVDSVIAANDETSARRRALSNGAQGIDREPGERAAISNAAPSNTSISGIVIDDACLALGWSERPAADVLVRCSELTGSGAHNDLETRTNAQGRFVFALESERDTRLDPRILIAADDDYREAGHFVTVEPGKSIDDLRIDRVAHGFLSGVTVDRQGKPLAGVSLRFRGSRTEVVAESDESGAFRFERFRDSDGKTSSIVKSGYRVLAAPWPVIKPDGGWQPLNIVLARSTGKIALTVLGSNGVPRAGILGRVEVSRSERDARRGPEPGFFGDSRPKEALVASDAHGRIEFTNLWSDSKLVITLIDEKRTLQAEHVSHEDLVFSGDTGEPIVVSGPSLDLRARLPERMHLSGIVVRADGTPVINPHVDVRDVGSPRTGNNSSAATLIGDDQGRFSHVFDPEQLPVEIRVSATDGPLMSQSGLGYAGDDKQPVEFQSAPYRESVSEVLMLVPSDLDAERSIRLVLQPTYAIAGRARDDQGSKIGVRVTAVPSGTTRRYDFVQSRSAKLREDGAFRIEGLRAGVYDLLIDPAIGTQLDSSSVPGVMVGYGITVEPLASIRIPAVRAGTEDLDVRIAPCPTVELTVEARPRDGSADYVLLVLGRSDPSTANGEARPEPPTVAVFGDHVGWPTHAMNSHGFADRDDTYRANVSIVKPGTTFTWPPLAEGCYWIGLRSLDKETRTWSYTEGSGWVYLHAGKYHFTFETVPTTTVDGRLMSRELDRSMCVALAEGSGRLLRIQTDRTTIDTIVPIGADGSFSIAGAPVGRFTLRVGHESELRRGQFQLERPIEIGERGDVPIEIQIP